MNYGNCTECPGHEIQSDPDPDDWFCSDDVKVQCKHTGKYITVSCRPTSIIRECTPTPDWCPFKNMKKDSTDE